MSLVLAGFMGAGKSTAARIAGGELGTEAVDVDTEFERRFGPIDAFFAAHGEPAFRAREEALVLELLDAGPRVIALGGGAVESAKVRAALRAHEVAWIDAPVEACWQRVHNGHRPLAQDRDTFAARFARRRPLYEEVATAILPTAGAIRPVLPVLQRLPPGARIVWASTAGGQYPVVVGAGVREVDPGAPGRAFTVTDDVVGPLWAPDAPIVVPAGEEHKRLTTAERVWDALLELDATRGDHVRAVGGGVVGDLAGFCAATYQRGIPIVQVPTTVVAQVDAAIGGKTAVDLPQAKNFIGAYHQPRAVLADTDVLATLPDAQVAEGYAEVLKTALIAGGDLWRRIADGAGVDGAVVFACARTKVDVVAGDERDGGRRQVLNLGHTVGHALEVVSGFGLTHGRAVALGLLAALRLSGQDALRAQVAELLAAAGLPTRLDGPLDVDAVVAATRRDKKRTGAEVPFVLVRAPGDVRHGQPVPDGELRAAVGELAA